MTGEIEKHHGNKNTETDNVKYDRPLLDRVLKFIADGVEIVALRRQLTSGAIMETMGGKIRMTIEFIKLI